MNVEEIRAIRNKNYEACRNLTDKEIIERTQKNSEKFKKIQESILNKNIK